MFEWIVSSCVLIVIVMLLRRLTKGRISSRLRYALWLPVLLRLLIPLSFGAAGFSAAGIVPEWLSSRMETAVDRPLVYVDYELPDLSVVEPDPTLSESEQKLQYEKNLAAWEYEMEKAKAETGRAVTTETLLATLWLAGAGVFAICLIASNLRFAARLRRSRTPLAVDAPCPVYVSAIVETPCLFGIFRPAIYLPPEAAKNETALRHVIAHESTHARHGDHIWSALRGICLVLHWYNPLVWLAAGLSRQDAELACDEGALLRLGEAERTSYGSTLIALATGHAGLLITATTMSGGKRSLKERVALIAKKPKNAAIAVALVLVIAAAAIVCAFAGRSGGWQSVDAKKLDTGVLVNAMSGKVSWPETAYVYESTFDHLEREQHIRELIGNNAGADGNFMISDKSILLSNYGPNGSRIRDAIPYNAQPDATMSYQVKNISKSDYGSADLSFMPIDEAAKKAAADIEALGVSGFELIEKYTIDKDTLAQMLEKNIEWSLATGVQTEEEMRHVYPFLFETVTEEDECYFFVFQLMLDDIPVLTCPSSQVELDIFGAELYCLYNETGIIDLQAVWVPSAAQPAGEAQPIIPADEAMEIFAPYVFGRHTGPIVEELSFCYTYWDKREAVLHPTWVLKVSVDVERIGISIEEKTMVTLYDYYAIDAITGEPLIREMKLK